MAQGAVATDALVAVDKVSQVGAQYLGPIAATLAHGEGLSAHQRAAELRIKR